MTEFFETASRAEEENNAIIKSYRATSLVCGLAIIIFGVVRSLTQPEGQDPIAERLLVSALCFCYAALINFNTPVRRYASTSIALLACVILAFCVHLAHLTGFSVNSAFAILLVAVIASLLVRTRGALLLFQVTALVVTASVMLRTENSTVSPMFFLSTMTSLCILTYLSQAFRMTTEDNLRLARTQALSAADARTQFLANMSHEIRTPMNGVIGMTHLLAQTELDSTQTNYLKTIQISGETLLNIINDILDFSKVDAGELELDLHQFDFIDCLENTVDLAKQACYDEDLKLHLIIEPQVPQFIIGDSTRIRQVIINLLNNATKFTSEGSITLKVGGHRKEDGFEIDCSVSDTGIGIAPESMGQLFQAFSQADTSTTRKYGGSGLGLSITKQLIDRMGGEISVHSVPDEGSNFFFHIPIQLPDDQLATPELPEFAHLRGDTASILIYAESEKPKQDLVAFFGRCDISVEVPPDRSTAVCLLQKNRYEIVFSDAKFARDITQRINLIQIANGSKRYPEAKQVLEQPFTTSKLEELLHKHSSTSFPRQAPKPKPKLDVDEIRVLLAEDNIINQKVATKMLEKHGFDVDLAKDGAEALEAIRNHHYDVVLMDLQMPQMSGLEVTKQVRSEGQHCPIIALTANAFEEDRHACFSAGMNAYLSKPLRQDALDTEIRRALRH